MAEEANDGSPPSGPHLWTLFFDDGTKDGLRVDCTEEKVAEYILSRRAIASTPTLAPGASERVPLAEIPRFAPIFNGAEANAIARVAGMDQAARLRTFSTLCKVCAYFFVVVGIFWLLAALASGFTVNGRSGLVGALVAALLAIVPIATVPVAFFTLSAIAEGVAALLDQGALRRVRGS
jgi:hypothetical protein